MSDSSFGGWARWRKTSPALAVRSRIMLACADGASITDVAGLGVSRDTVRNGGGDGHEPVDHEVGLEAERSLDHDIRRRRALPEPSREGLGADC